MLKMTLIILVLGYLLDEVYANALPQMTQAAQLVPRQTNGVITLWSPTVIGTALTYVPFTPPGTNEIIVTYASYWEFCRGAASDCDPWTTCVQGTVYDHTTSAVCDNTAPVCGTEYLFPTLGAANALTGYACYPSATTQSFFVASPTLATSSSTSSSTVTSSSVLPMSTTPNVPPSPTPKPKPPVGAIVGGVIAGLVAIAIIAGVILLIVRKHRQQPSPANPAVGAAEVQQQPPPPDSPHDPKHPSYVSSYPPSPTPAPPQYQSAMSQVTPPYNPAIPASPNPADAYGAHFPSVSVPVSPPIHQYGNMQATAMPSQSELPYNVAAPYGIAEMNADQTRR